MPCSFAGWLSIEPWRPRGTALRVGWRFAEWVQIAPPNARRIAPRGDSSQSPIDRLLAPHDRPSRNGHRRAGRRRRQGPKAARTRGRSEAQSLVRCRAQREPRMRDGRQPAASSHLRSQRVTHMITKRAPRMDHFVPDDRALQCGTNGAKLKISRVLKNGGSALEVLAR